MNKSLKALLMGFVFFKVNGKPFFRYNSALAEKNNTVGNINFKGFSIFRGWRMFFVRIESSGRVQASTYDADRNVTYLVVCEE